METSSPAQVGNVMFIAEVVVYASITLYKIIRHAVFEKTTVVGYATGGINVSSYCPGKC